MEAARARKLRHWLFTAPLLVVLSLVGYGILLQPDHVPYSKFSDNIALNLASKKVLYDSLQRGEGLPLWRTDVISGAPGLTSPQALYTYPLHGLFWFLPPTTAVGPTLWLHMLLVAWVFFLLGGVLGLGLFPRWLMAIAAMFQFKLIMAIYVGWLPTIPGFVCVPMLLTVVLDGVRRPRLASLIWMALVGALCLHCGHVQTFYYMVLALVIWLAYLALRRLRASGTSPSSERTQTPGGADASSSSAEDLPVEAGLGDEVSPVGGAAVSPEVPWRLYLWLGGGALLAVGMASYLLYPMWQEAPLTVRSQLDYRSFLAGHGAGARHYLTLLFPEALGTPLHGTYAPIELWEDVAYFGLIPLLLCLVGVIGGWRRRFVPFLTAGWLVFLLLPIDSPVLRFCYDYVPGFRLFRCPTRMFYVSSMFGLALAGVGADVVLQWLKARDVSAVRIYAVVGVVLCVIAGEGVIYANRYIQMMPTDRAFPTTRYQAFLRDKKGPYRVAGLWRPTLNSGWAPFLGLQLIHGFEPYTYRHYQAYISLLISGRYRPRRGAVWTDITGLRRRDLFDMLNGRYLLSPKRLSLPSGHALKLVAQWPKQPMFLLYGGFRDQTLFLYENTRALPRAFWAQQVQHVRSKREVIAGISRSEVRRVAFLVGQGRNRTYSWAHPGKGIQYQRTHGDIMALKIQQPHKTRRFLIASQIWHPQWRAYLNGKPVALHRVNLALMGLWVPPGEHQLQLVFQPAGWPLLPWLSGLCGLLTLVLMGFVGWRQRRGT